MLRRSTRKNLLIAQLLLLFIGLTFFYIASIASIGNPWNLLFFGLATSMMATILLSILEPILGTDVPTLITQKLRFNQQVYDMGLETVHSHAEDNISVFDKFESAQTIDMMFHTGTNACLRYGMRLIHAIEAHGCRVRVLIADQNNPIWDIKEITEALAPACDTRAEIKETLSYLQIQVNELKQRKPSLKKGSLEIKTYSNQPTCSIVIVDGKYVRHVPYLPFSRSTESPVYILVRERGGELFKQYESAFERVWIRSKTVFKEDWTLRPRKNPASHPGH